MISVLLNDRNNYVLRDQIYGVNDYCWNSVRFSFFLTKNCKYQKTTTTTTNIIQKMAPATTTFARKSQESQQNIDMMIMQAKATQQGKKRRNLLGACRSMSKRLLLRQNSGFLKCADCNRTVAWGGYAKSQRTKLCDATCRSCKIAAAKKNKN